MTAGRPQAMGTVRAAEVRAAAAEVFAERGFAATRIGDIADAAGVQAGSLYHHFASKEDLAALLLEDYFARIDSGLGEYDAWVRRSSPDDQEAVRVLAARMVEVSSEHKAAIRLRAHEAPRAATPRLRKLLKHLPVLLRPSWDDAVARIARGRNRYPHDASMLAQTLQRTTLMLPTTSIRLERAPMAEAICDVLLDGVAEHVPTDRDLDASPALVALRVRMRDWSVAGQASGALSANLLSVARREFATRGYLDTSIREISDLSGVSLATLYRRVASKEELLWAVISPYLDRLDDALIAIWESDSDAVEKLDALGVAVANARKSFREESIIVHDLEGLVGVLAGDSVKDISARRTTRREAFASLIQSGQDRGEIRADIDADSLAKILRTILWTRHAHSPTRITQFFRTSHLRGYSA